MERTYLPFTIKLQVKPIHSFIIRDYVVGLAETAKVALIYLP